MEDKFLCYGDIVLFYSDFHHGYIQSSGFIDNRVFIQPMQHENAEIFTENQRQFLFRVLPKLSYEFQKDFLVSQREFQTKNLQIKNQTQKIELQNNQKSEANTEEIRTALSKSIKEEQQNLQQKKMRADDEREMNENLKEGKNGQNALYGDEVQFQHIVSDYFLKASNQVADLDKTCYKIKLQEKASSGFVFKILPRFKYRQEGEKIMFGDQLVIQACKNQLNIKLGETPFPIETEHLQALDRRTHPIMYLNRYEVNLSYAPYSIQLVNFGSNDKQLQQ